MKFKKSEKKKKRILDAAVKVFASKGVDNTRISDIAKEARVAYGLVYHYFKGKERILNIIFTESWNVFLKILEEIMNRECSFREKLYNIVSFLINMYISAPDLIKVIIIEVIHSNRIKSKDYLKGFMKSFTLFEDGIEKHVKNNEIRNDINKRLMTIMVFGALEMIFSGFALRGLNLNEFESEEKLKEEIVNLIMQGIRSE